MSIDIKYNKKNKVVLSDGILVKSIDDDDYGILIITDRLEEKYNVLLLSREIGYPETVYSKGVSLDIIENGFVKVANVDEYDISLTIGKD